MTRDLPAFDSVWLDALVSEKYLTPFQAKVLDSEQQDQLSIGDYILMGRDVQEPHCTVDVARKITGTKKREVKERLSLVRMPIHESKIEATYSRLKETAVRISTLNEPTIIGPVDCFRYKEKGNPVEELISVCSYQTGPTLRELIVRRGRFPFAVVAQIARQLLKSLTTLHSSDLVHGDLRLRNVVVGANGKLYLTRTAIQPTVTPKLTLHENLPIDAYDGLAPESIGPLGGFSASSDLYAVGCLLWELLVGRPPYTTANFIEKMSHHKKRTIDNVRDWNPDVSKDFADWLSKLTAGHPAKRFRSADDAIKSLGKKTVSSRGHIRTYLAGFHKGVRQKRTAISRPAVSALSILLILVSCSAGLAWSIPASRLTLLELGQTTISKWKGEDETSTSKQESEGMDSSSLNLRSAESEVFPVENAKPESKYQELPEISATGEMFLNSRKPYLASTIEAVGRLQILCQDEMPATIIVKDDSLKIVAEELILQNVKLTTATHDPQISSMMLVRAQSIYMNRCQFESEHGIDSENSLHAIGWKLLDSSQAATSRCLVKNSVFTNNGASYYLASSIPAIQFENCLKLNRGSLLQLSSADANARDMKLELKHVTLRNANSVVLSTQEELSRGHVSVFAYDCVFDFQDSRSAVFVSFESKSNAKKSKPMFEVIGLGTLLPPGTTIWGAIDSNDYSWSTPDTSLIPVEGVLSTNIQYKGAFTQDSENSLVEDFQGPRSSSQKPGFLGVK